MTRIHLMPRGSGKTPVFYLPNDDEITKEKIAAAKREVAKFDIRNQRRQNKWRV